MLDLNLTRSLLFTPGSRPDRFAKAAATAADGLIIDLEDAVGPADKATARVAVMDWLRRREGVKRAGFLVCLRINSVFNDFGLRDLVAVAELARASVVPDVILLPKVESAAEVDLVARHLRATGPAGAGVALVALIESAAGLEEATRIAKSTPVLRALGFGGVDLAADLRATFCWESMLAGRGRLVQAASMAGLGLLDVPYLDINDDAGISAECQRVRAMGFSGKLAIHPRQVDFINAAFTPTAAEVEFAQGVAAAYDAANGGVCTYKGKMIDEPVMLSARRTLARATKQ